MKTLAWIVVIVVLFSCGRTPRFSEEDLRGDWIKLPAPAKEPVIPNPMGVPAMTFLEHWTMEQDSMWLENDKLYWERKVIGTQVFDILFANGDSLVMKNKSGDLFRYISARRNRDSTLVLDRLAFLVKGTGWYVGTFVDIRRDSTFVESYGKKHDHVENLKDGVFADRTPPGLFEFFQERIRAVGWDSLETKIEEERVIDGANMLLLIRTNKGEKKLCCQFKVKNAPLLSSMIQDLYYLQRKLPLHEGTITHEFPAIER